MTSDLTKGEPSCCCVNLIQDQFCLSTRVLISAHGCIFYSVFVFIFGQLLGNKRTFLSGVECILTDNQQPPNQPVSGHLIKKPEIDNILYSHQTSFSSLLREVPKTQTTTADLGLNASVRAVHNKNQCFSDISSTEQWIQNRENKDERPRRKMNRLCGAAAASIGFLRAASPQ